MCSSTSTWKLPLKRAEYLTKINIVPVDGLDFLDVDWPSVQLTGGLASGDQHILHLI